MKKKWVVCVACILILCMTAAVPVFAAGKNAQNDKTDYLDEMTGELDFSKLDHFMGQDAGDGGITFSELVEELLHQENPGTVYQQLGPWLVSQLCESVRENRKILVEVVLLAVCFSVLKNFAAARSVKEGQSYVGYVAIADHIYSFNTFKDYTTGTKYDTLAEAYAAYKEQVENDVRFQQYKDTLPE